MGDVLLNIRFHTQGEGCPIFDPCTTVRRGHDDQGREVIATYRGWSICPLGRWGILWALAVTRRHSLEVGGIIQ